MIKPKKLKDDRGATISSEILPTNSKKLNLSRKQFFRRRKKTLAALVPIHKCAKTEKKLPQNNKPVLDGLWTTLIYTASKPEMTAKSQRKLGSLRKNLEILKENKEQRSLS